MMTTPARPISVPREGALPWLAAGLLVSAGTAWLVGSSRDAGGITLDVAALLAVGLVVLVLVIDAVLPRAGAPVAALLMIAWSGAVGAVAACLAIVAGLGFVPAAFLVAAAVVAVAGIVSAATRRSSSAPIAPSPQGAAPAQTLPAAAAPAQTAPAVALALYLEPVNAVLRLVRGVNHFVGDSREDPGWNARHGIPAERRNRPR
jgi:FtsH-binding integral membrane protein